MKIQIIKSDDAPPLAQNVKKSVGSALIVSCLTISAVGLDWLGAVECILGGMTLLRTWFSFDPDCVGKLDQLGLQR